MTDGEKEAIAKWNLVIFTQGGGVGTLQNLNTDEARRLYRNLLPGLSPIKYINGDEIDLYGPSYTISKPPDSKVVRVEVSGPGDVDFDPWKGIEPDIIDVSEFVVVPNPTPGQGSVFHHMKPQDEPPSPVRESFFDRFFKRI